MHKNVWHACMTLGHLFDEVDKNNYKPEPKC